MICKRLTKNPPFSTEKGGFFLSEHVVCAIYLACSRARVRVHWSQTSVGPQYWTAHTFGQHRKRIFWIGGSAIALVCALLLYHFILAPYRHRGRACFGESEFPANYSIHGIDVSHHQGTVNWEKVATASDANGARVQFVFVKATQGKSHLDRKFRHNFRKAQQYGLVRGAYHYFSPGISGDEQAHHFIKNVPLEKGDLPPVLDVEVLGRLKPETLSREVLEWLDMMEKRFGTPPIIYTYLTFKKNYLNTPEFDRYPFWIAHYKVKKLRYKGAWDFWQHTEEGCIDGITGKVDLNVYNGSMYDLQKLTIGNDRDNDEPQEKKTSPQPAQEGKRTK